LQLPKDDQQRSLVTRSALITGLRQAGIESGDVLCAHVSLSRLGYVCGAAQTVIAALRAALGSGGTLMMPTFSGELSDPAEWRFPPVPSAWIEPIRDETPGYDPRLTPTRHMGTCAELFRNYPGVLRSPHPQSSFAACGSGAETLVLKHPMDFRFGPQSPLGRLAACDGKILLLGAGVERATFVYLAQFMAGIGAELSRSAPVTVGGETRWVRYRDIAVDNVFVRTGMEFMICNQIARRTSVGDAVVITFPARKALAALLDWAWSDAGVANERSRNVTPMPVRWSDWL
jgi:aminoglycoside 3-N-acetyltransferase